MGYDVHFQSSVKFKESKARPHKVLQSQSFCDVKDIRKVLLGCAPEKSNRLMPTLLSIKQIAIGLLRTHWTSFSFKPDSAVIQ